MHDEARYGRTKIRATCKKTGVTRSRPSITLPQLSGVSVPDGLVTPRGRPGRCPIPGELRATLSTALRAANTAWTARFHLLRSPLLANYDDRWRSGLARRRAKDGARGRLTSARPARWPRRVREPAPPSVRSGALSRPKSGAPRGGRQGSGAPPVSGRRQPVWGRRPWAAPDSASAPRSRRRPRARPPCGSCPCPATAGGAG